MRPIALIALLVLVAAALVGGLLLIGRDAPSSPTGGGPAPAAETAAAPTDAPPTAAPALEASGAEAREDVRAAPEVVQRPAEGSGPLGAAEKPPVVVRGRVLGTLGRPIAGATVLAAETDGFNDSPLDELLTAPMSWFPIAQATTDSDGRFEVRPQARSKVTLAVRAPGHAPLDREFALSGSTRDVGELALDASLVLVGRVVDSGGRPIEGASLARLSGPDAGFSPFGRARGAPVGETDAQGAFRVDQLGPGEWHLSITHADHPDLVEKGEGDRPGAVRTGLVFAMADGIEIHGRVVGAPPGTASKLTIRAALAPAGESAPADTGMPFEFRPPGGGGSSREATCAEDGTFKLTGLVPGRNYRLSARDTEGPRFFGRSRSAPTTARAGDRGIEIPYRAESALVFQAVDALSGEPVVELSVRAGYGFSMPLMDENGQAVKRFPEGRVRFGDLPARPRGPSGPGLKLTVESPGYQAHERKDVALVEGQDTDLGVIRLERAPVVKVLVLDAASGAPVADAAVSIAEQEAPTGMVVESRFAMRLGSGGDVEDAFAPGNAQRARTGEDGRARLTSLPGKTALLRVRHAGHAPHRSEPIELPAAEDLELTVRLGLGGKVLVEVVDNHGTPVSGVAIEHRAPDDGSGEFVFGGGEERTDADGLLAFEHLTPGEHRFRMGRGDSAGFVSIAGSPASVGRMTRRARAGGMPEPEEEGWTNVAVVEGASETLKLVAPARGSLSGRVTESGQALANAELRLVSAAEDSEPMPFGGNGRDARTDGRGEYLFDGVEEGEYRIEVRHPSRAMSHEAKTRVREGENDLDVDLPVAVVEGTITGADGKPLPGVRVRAERAPSGGAPGRRSYSFAVMVMDDGNEEPEISVGPPGGGTTVTTDAEGRYTLRGVAPDVDLVVHATGKEVQPGKSEPFHVAADGVKKNVDIKLEDGGSIEVTVRRASSGPAGRYLARATPVDGGEPKIQMVGPSASTKFTGLKPGKWRIVLDPMMGPLEGGEEPQNLEQEVEVVVGQAAKASFDTP